MHNDSTVPFLDIHTHNSDDEVRGQEIIQIFNVNFTSSEVDLTTLAEHSYSIGIHPYCIDELSWQKQLLELDAILTKFPTIDFIGECGLDKMSSIPIDIQTQVFVEIIFLSEKHRKPLIIHCVRAHQEILNLKTKIKPTQQWIIHGFRKNVQLANQYVVNGVKLSFGKHLITDENLQHVFAQLPIESIFFETDDDNNIDIKNIYAKAASLRNVDLQTLKMHVWSNYRSLLSSL
ncbi:MAG: TatD family hydrolase [Saprospiraceae bacterium]|nr:TatD family hydrolase [Saprospiraceae bacterium]